MQMIMTKFLPWTDTKGMRVRATYTDTDRRESVTVSWSDELEPDANHDAAMRALCAKHDVEFQKGLDGREHASERFKADGWANAEYMRGCNGRDGYAYVRILKANRIAGKVSA